MAMSELEACVKAGFSIIWMRTCEEDRAEAYVLDTAARLEHRLKFWSCTEGITEIMEDGTVKTNEIFDPEEALQEIKQGNEEKNIIRDPETGEEEYEARMYMFRDLHPFLKESNAVAVRMLRDIAKVFKQVVKTLIIVSPVLRIPPELERDIAVIELPLPTRLEIAENLGTLCDFNDDVVEVIGGLEDGEKDKIVEAAGGLTINECEAVISKAMILRADSMQNGKEDVPEVSSLVLKEKAKAVKKTGILEWHEASETIKDVGGLENLKSWLEVRSKCFSKEAREFGLPSPKGIVLVGLPGCGKSLCSRVTSSVFDVPLIKFDIGTVFQSLVGESEQRIRSVISMAEAIGSCVIWIDEIEKGFAGAGGSGNLDSGVTRRVFGTFLTWMSDKTCPAFVVATLNGIAGLPPELLRKGRFDEIFFIGLPSEDERAVILAIHIRKHGRDPKKFDLKKLAKASENFSGSELEQAVVSGLYTAFHTGKELTAGHIAEAIEETTPLATSFGSQLSQMVDWADKFAVNASRSVKEEEPKPVTGRKRGKGRTRKDGGKMSGGRQLRHL